MNKSLRFKDYEEDLGNGIIKVKNNFEGCEEFKADLGYYLT